MRLTVLILALLCGPAWAQETQLFDGWTASCRADGYCSAQAGAPDAANWPAGTILRIGRHAEETYWEVSLTTLGPVADPASPLTMTVDGGEAQNFTGPAEVAAYGSRNDLFFLGTTMQAAMDRITPGAALAIDFTDTAGAAQQAAFPLTGLNAALIWIDEQQGRIGSERVTEAPPIGRPALPVEIPPALLAQRAADTDCTALADLPADRITADPAIGDGMTLYILPCWSHEANTGSKAYLETTEHTFTSIAVPQVAPDEGWTATTHLLNAYYDAAAQELITGYSGRDGNCAAFGRWRWQPHAFRLVELRAQPDCEAPAQGAEGLPLLFPEQPPAN